MKHVILFLLLVLFVNPVFGENHLINPGFDESPWDTGWVLDSISGYIAANPDTTFFLSPPNSCKLEAWHGHTTEPCGKIAFYQEIDSVRCCTLFVSFRNEIKQGASGGGAVKIFVKVNDVWVEEWSTYGSNTIWTNWGKLYDTTEIVNGIKFYAAAWTSMNGFVGWTQFWIDNAYIGGTLVGIEEGREREIDVFKIYPNPFITQTTIFFSFHKQYNDFEEKGEEISIHDITGRIVRKFRYKDNRYINQIIWDGRNSMGDEVPSGVYFIRFWTSKMKGFFQSKKIIKLPKKF